MHTHMMHPRDKVPAAHKGLEAEAKVADPAEQQRRSDSVKAGIKHAWSG